MKVSGFTFVRHAVALDFPVVESIKSILPIVDEYIVNIGPDDDGTLSLISSIKDSKIKIIQSQWNPNLVSGGYVYAQQTNIALFNCTGDWAIYLQADEVIHEDDLPLIQDFMQKYLKDERVEGLALNELTFWGDYKTLLKVYPWAYSKRCWVVKPHKFVLSRGDAAGFTVHPKYKERGRKIRVLDTGGRVFHYSFVRSEEMLKKKAKLVLIYWQDRYSQHDIDRITVSLYKCLPRQFMTGYSDSHPKVMETRIKNHSISVDLDSKEWREQLIWNEYKLLIKTKLVKIFGESRLGWGAYKLLSF